jgi:hypothetical protein
MLLGGHDLQSMGIPEFIFEVSLRLPTRPCWLFVSLVLITSPYYLLVPIVGCELSLDPEVAILFGREIGQSNGVLLTGVEPARIKVG